MTTRTRTANPLSQRLSQRRRGPGRSGSARRLTMEPLEQRALLSMTSLVDAYKTMTFTSTANYTGTNTATGYHDAFTGHATELGTLAYSSPTVGTGSIQNASSGCNGSGADTYGSYTFTYTGQATMDDNSGTLSRYAGSVTTVYNPIQRPQGGGTPYDVPLTVSMSIASYPFQTSFTWSTVVGGLTTQGSGTGQITLPSTSGFDVQLTAGNWVSGGVEFSFAVPGPVHVATNESTPITNIQLFWASGNQRANIIGAPLTDKKDLFWNHSTGTVQVTNLPTAPQGATYLLIIADYANSLQDEASEANNLVALSLPPEFTVSGNGTTILDNDATPSTTDGTDFGHLLQGQAGLSRTFRVQNTSSVALTTANFTYPAGYTVVDPLATSIAGGSYDDFTLQLPTGTLGDFSGDISFTNNGAATTSPFNFRITGSVTTDNSIANAHDLGTLGAAAVVLNDFIGSADTEDYYRFQIPLDGPVTVSVSGLTADVDLQWVSDTGTVLGTVSHVGTTDEIATAMFGGNWPYYLRVYQVSGDTNYTLSLTRGGTAAFDTAGNSIPAARDLGSLSASASEMYEYVGVADTDDYFRFQQPGEGPVTVSVSGLSANVDLQWLSDTGVVLGTVSHAGTTDEVATATFGGNWPYYLRVYSVSGSTSYTLSLTRGGVATFDTAGSSIAAARDLGTIRASASEMYEYVGSTDTDDYFCFRQPGEGPVTVSVSGLSTDVDLQWLSDTGVVLGTVSHVGTTDEIATATFGGNWPYYLRVYSLGGNTNYTLSLSRGGLSTFDTAGNNIATARDLGNLRASASEMYEYVGSADTDDYFCFQQPGEGPVTVSVSGLAADVDLQWLSDTGVVLGTVSHAGNTDEIATATFGPNWPYYLRVYSVSGGDTNYTLSLSRGGLATFDTAGNSIAAARDLGNLRASASEMYEYVGSTDTDDYYSFRQPAEGPVTVSVSGLSADVDLQWLSDTGTVLGTVSHAGTADEIATATFGGNWPYYLRVYRVSGDTNYNLSLSRGGTSTFDTAGNSLAAARDLGNITASAAQVIEYVGDSDPQDYFCFRQPVEGLVTVTLSGLSADADLQVLTDTGTVVMSSTTAGTANETIALTFGGNWPYYLRVYQASGNTSYTLSLTKGAPLLAADQPIAGTLGSALADGADVAPLMQTALAYWESLGQSLRPVRVVITDLPGSELGRAINDTIYLDRDAAGHGWFVDPTPALDEEFARLGSQTQLTAVDARAADKIDLLTVIEHELGHVAGLRDLDASATSLMSGALSTGVRRVAATKELDALFAASDVR